MYIVVFAAMYKTAVVSLLGKIQLLTAAKYNTKLGVVQPMSGQCCSFAVWDSVQID